MDYEKAYKAVLQTATQWIKDGCTDKEKTCLESIFPELRESEDERMRKLIINRVRSATEMTEGLRELLLNYLEKQKEPENISASTIIPSCWECEQKEQKPISQEDFDTAKHEALWDEQKPIDANHIVNAILSALSSGLETDEILKARGFTYDDVENWLNSTRNPAIEYIRGQNKIFENPEKYGLCKPAEWSEKDKIIIKGACNALEIYGHTKLANMLKSIRPQPKQEWNEYDNEMFHCICDSLCYLRKLYETNEDKVSDYNAMIEWFRNRFKSLRTSWKPTEEQMRALKNSAYGSYQNGDGPLLRELYDDLLKLK